jgi:hypothetical protein
VGHHVAVDLDVALGHLELGAFDAAEGFEGRTGGAPALRAVTDQRVLEFIGDGVTRRAAQATAV